MRCKCTKPPESPTMTISVWKVPRGDQMSMVIGVYSIFGIEPHIVQKGLVISNIVRFRENVVAAKHFSAGMYLTAVTQLLATLMVRSSVRSCKPLETCTSAAASEKYKTVWYAKESVPPAPEAWTLSQCYSPHRLGSEDMPCSSRV